MQTYKIEASYFFPVFLFENGAVDVKLEGIMPEIGVWKMRYTLRFGPFIEPTFIRDFLAAFPVIYLESAVGVFENHIDGSR